MHRDHMYVTMIVLTAVLQSASRGWAAEPSPSDADAKLLRTAMEQYDKAFSRGDAGKLAEYWTETGEYVGSFGERILGRDAIKKAYEELFASGKKYRLESTTTHLRLIAAQVVVEEGTSRLTSASEPPAEALFEAVYVKENGRWKLARVREEELPRAASHYEQLKELEWMVGQWVDQDENATVHTKCEWTRNNNFLTRSFSVRVQGRTEMDGTQVIGWDPVSRQIRSWTFDSDGTVTEGAWTRDGRRWVVKTKGVLPDGRKAAATNIITQLDGDTFSWQSVGCQAGGELLPSVAPFKVVRVASK